MKANVCLVVGCAAWGMCTAGVSRELPQISTVLQGTAHQALYSIASFDATIFTVGASGEIRESGDGGNTWKVSSPATDLALLGVTAGRTGQIAVGQKGVILRREGGDAWSRVDSGTTNRLFSVALNSQGKAVAVGSFGTVLKSDDSGATWHSVAPEWAKYAADGVEPHIYDVNLDDAGVATIVGEFGLILRSQDEGTTWKLVHKGEASLLALDLKRADRVGYAVGQTATVLRTQDGGATWSVVHEGGGSILLGVRSSTKGEVYVTGMREMLVSDDGGNTWRRESGGDFTTEWYQGLCFNKAEDAVLIVGHSGRIVQLKGT